MSVFFEVTPNDIHHGDNNEDEELEQHRRSPLEPEEEERKMMLERRRSAIVVNEVSLPNRMTSFSKMFDRPKQRQRWNEDQILPHVNWGDLFFDLFYVGAAYNLSGILKDSPTMNGVLYYIGCFGPVMSVWMAKMLYDSRYSINDDLYHRCFQVIMLCLVATAVLHIGPVSILSHSTTYVDMFAFSLSMSLLVLGSVVQQIEIILCVDGENSAKRAARRDIFSYAGQAIFYIAATIVSGYNFFVVANNLHNKDTHTYEYNNHSSTNYDNTADADSHSRFLQQDNTAKHDEEDISRLYNYLIAILSNATSTHYNDYNGSSLLSSINGTTTSISRRFLASAINEATFSTYYPATNTTEDSTNMDTTTDIPIYLCLAGWLYSVLDVIVMVVMLPKQGGHKKVIVPMNIDFCIHRFGEYTMLMLGESILSLLIVEIDKTTTNNIVNQYYITFYAGILSVILLQYLHYRSQPHTANEHALRLTKEAGVIYTTLYQLYSMALVAVGVSYKMLLYEYTYYNKDTTKYESSEESSPHRRALLLLQDILTRQLAGSSSSSEETQFTTEERQQRIAHIFCASMALVWLCLDLMILSHHKIMDNSKRMYCKIKHTISSARLLLILLRIVLILFIGTLSQYVTQPVWICVIGLVGIVVQVKTRLIGDVIFPSTNESLHCDRITQQHHRREEEDPKETTHNDDNGMADGNMKVDPTHIPKSNTSTAATNNNNIVLVDSTEEDFETKL